MIDNKFGLLYNVTKINIIFIRCQRGSGHCSYALGRWYERSLTSSECENANSARVSEISRPALCDSIALN